MSTSITISMLLFEVLLQGQEEMDKETISSNDVSFGSRTLSVLNSVSTDSDSYKLFSGDEESVSDFVQTDSSVVRQLQSAETEEATSFGEEHVFDFEVVFLVLFLDGVFGGEEEDNLILLLLLFWLRFLVK